MTNGDLSAKGWTLDTYAAHNEALRGAEEKFQSERDRRYTEVKNAEEKALRIKEQADRDALQLAREIQSYKDEKANELREQINSERGLYATHGDLQAVVEKFDATMKPITEFIASARGRGSGMSALWGWALGALVAINIIFQLFATLATKH
jgi:vacuolar-type H+-ATPase subunit H